MRIEKVDKQTTRRYDGSEIVVAEGVAGDSTGVIKFRVSGGNSLISNFFFILDYAKELEVGKVVAWRNCLSQVIRGFHRLSLDDFGRITPEDVKIEKLNFFKSSLVSSINTTGKKYSEVEYERKTEVNNRRP